MKYRIDNQTLQATTPTEVVTELWESSRFGEADRDAYRSGFAKRQLEYDGSVIRSDSDENFVADLIENGILEVL